ncbi:MAG: hypothetical protein WCX65_19820 [bacterium]
MKFFSRIIFASALVILTLSFTDTLHFSTKISDNSGIALAAEFGTENTAPAPAEKSPEPVQEKPAAPEKAKSAQAAPAVSKPAPASDTVKNATQTEPEAPQKKVADDSKKKNTTEKESDGKKDKYTTVQIQRVGGSTTEEDIIVTKPASGEEDSKRTGTARSYNRATGRNSESAEDGFSSDTELIQIAVEKAIDRRIAPLEDMVRESQHHGPDFFTLIGFLGYIAGLLGLYTYLKNRPRKI